ncbi:HtaA domain-containing protein [Streptomyces shenzhenensis]|uniref:HtaA domain-containing protein n=1 Tax=Streptomyces shenzhenensis TaxID=943815 RepID=UPI003F540213
MKSDGTGTLTATVTGYGADMNDPGKWVPLPATTVTLADLSGVELGASGFTVAPDYLGVSVSVPAGTTGQPAKSDGNKAYWGSFPQSFVDFQQLTGQSSYWFTSGGSRDAAKPTTPLTVGYTTPDATPGPTPSGPGASPTVSAAPTSSPGRPTATAGASSTATAAATCELTDGIKGSSLTWGFKKSFRSYVGAPAANSITAGDGLKILAQDQAVAGKNSTGTYQWPFASSSAYTSPDDFTVRYGGSITFDYPAHYFTIEIAKPRLTVHGKAGTLYADVSLTVSAPGSKPSTNARSDIALASLDLSGSTPVTSSAGITRTMRTAIQDTEAFTFDGNSFYQKGQELDDATVLLSGCTGTAPIAGSDGAAAGSGDSAGGQGTGGAGDDSALVPDLKLRPDEAGQLAGTGVDDRTTGVVALSAVGCVTVGLALVGLTRRRRRSAAAYR